jgi:acetyltransferase-like isoleucine patch superfamily enzyme
MRRHPTTSDRSIPGDWHPGTIPSNVIVDPTVYIETSYSFDRFRSTMPQAVRLGRGVSVYQGTMFDLGPLARVDIADFALLNGVRIVCEKSIRIGEHALISWNVVLMDTYQASTDPLRRRAALDQMDPHANRAPQSDGHTAAPIEIGPNVWLGFDVCVLPGVTIGRGSIVGARSVVFSDIPPYSIAVGNPARVIRSIERSPATL